MKVPIYKIKQIREKSNQYAIGILIYNEGNRILAELKRANESKISDIADIILLDGGTTDGSTEEDVLKKYNVNTLITMEEQGIYKQAEALKAGFDFVIKRGYKGIITIDGNNKDSIESSKDFIAKLNDGYDYIQGSRFIQGGEEENTPKSRMLAIKYIHAPLISAMAKKKYTDTTNMFRGYSMKYITDKRVQPFRNIFTAYSLSTFLSVRADQLNLKTCEIPVKRVYPNSRKFPTKVGRIKGNYKIIKSLIYEIIGKYNKYES